MGGNGVMTKPLLQGLKLVRQPEYPVDPVGVETISRLPNKRSVIRCPKC
jgi:hypothetical protein